MESFSIPCANLSLDAISAVFFCDCGCEFFDSVLVDSAVVDDSVVESGDVSVLTPDHGVGVKTVVANCFV